MEALVRAMATSAVSMNSIHHFSYVSYASSFWLRSFFRSSWECLASQAQLEAGWSQRLAGEHLARLVLAVVVLLEAGLAVGCGALGGVLLQPHLGLRM